MRTSFVYSTWNSRGEIEKSLASLELVGGEKTVIVVDQASTDGTRQFLSHITGIMPILLDRKVSWCKANEIGISYADTDWIVVTNPDIYYNSDFNKLLTWLQEQKPPYPIVGCNLRDPDGTYQKAAEVGSFRKMFVFSSSLTRLIGRFLLPDTMDQFGIPEAEHLTRAVGMGASIFIIHRSTIQLLGRLWGRAYLWPAADSDMFKRAIAKKIPILIFPISLVHHKWHSRKNSSLPDFDAICLYSFTVYARYWKEMHSNLMFILYLCNAITFPFMRFLARKDSLRNGIRRSAAQVKGILIGRRVQL